MKEKLLDIIDLVADSIDANKTEILTGVVILGVIGTAVSAVVATKKAVEEVDILTECKEETEQDPPTKKEIVKVVWKHYIPVALSAGTTIVSVLFLNDIHNNKEIALATACALTSERLKSTENHVNQLLDEKSKTELKEKVAKDMSEKFPDVQKTEAVQQSADSQNGEIRCQDGYTGQWFSVKNLQVVESLVNKLNAKLIHGQEETVDLNRILENYGIKYTEAASQIYWDSAHLIDMFPTSVLHDDGTHHVEVYFSGFLISRRR